jgi:3-oxoacyl-ACP reductase-like protein
MSVFGDIMSAIFGRSASAAPASSAAPSTSTPPPASAAPSAAPAAKPAQANVDVAAVLDGLAKQNKQKLNWRTSIVDLMKLLDLDSSSAARQHLADELHYQGDKKDSAKMNVWLHKQVMIKLAQNGGKVPDELKH